MSTTTTQETSNDLRDQIKNLCSQVGELVKERDDVLRDDYKRNVDANSKIKLTFVALNGGLIALVVSNFDKVAFSPLGIIFVGGALLLEMCVSIVQYVRNYYSNLKDRVFNAKLSLIREHVEGNSGPTRSLESDIVIADESIEFLKSIAHDLEEEQKNALGYKGKEKLTLRLQLEYIAKRKSVSYLLKSVSFDLIFYILLIVGSIILLWDIYKAIDGLPFQ